MDSIEKAGIALPPLRGIGAAMKPEWIDAAVVLLGRTGLQGTVGVTGSSMLPTLKAGQRLLVEFSPERLRIGELLLFRRGDDLVVHRLVASRRDGTSRRLVTRGDGVPRLDPSLDRSSILGRVVGIDDTDGRRDLRTVAARAYGLGVAWHDRFWAAMARLALGADRWAAKLGLKARFRPLVAALDRRLLRVAHGLLFRRVHGRICTEETTPATGRQG